MSNAEYIGKSHEKLTRDILNSDTRQSDTVKQLSYLDDDEKERVELGAEKAAAFIEEHTPFTITNAVEVGDARKTDPNDDTDLVVENEQSSKKWSLKLTSDTAINVRNTLASKMCEDIFEQPITEVMSTTQMEKYNEWTRKYASGECSGSDMASVLTPIFTQKFRYALTHARDGVRNNILEDIRLDANMVAVKITTAGNFHGFASMEREPLRKMMNGTGTISVYTTENNNTSIFFDVDNETAFRIDMYGQYAGGRMEKVKTVYRVVFD